MGLATSFTRRYHKNYQFGVTYTLMFYKHDTGIGSAGFGAMQVNNFNINTDWATSKDFQRHTLRANGVWTLPKGFSFSGFLRLRLAEPVVHDEHQRRSAGHRLDARPEQPDDHPAQQLLRRLVPDAGPAAVQGCAHRRHQGHRHRRGVQRSTTTRSSPTTRSETSAAFGAVNGTQGQPRTGQLALKMSF